MASDQHAIECLLAAIDLQAVRDVIAVPALSEREPLVYASARDWLHDLGLLGAILTRRDEVAQRLSASTGREMRGVKR